MPRTIDVAKVVHAAGESKFLNLDLTVREVASSGLMGAASVIDEPWDLICADWITLIRRGPRFDSVLEVLEMSNVLKETLATAGKAGLRG